MRRLAKRIHDLINDLSREDIKIILEDYGFAVCETESFNDLYDALFENIADGTIDFDSI